MTISFEHADAVRSAFPSLACGLLRVAGITSQADASSVARPYLDAARERLRRRAEGEFPEIQAWRRAFSAMGLKPTRYRCASEALLRRLRKEDTLPSLHPLVDVCNAVSAAFAIPIAVFDSAKIERGLVVGPARGDERFDTFAGTIETPEPGEIIFADRAGRAHARRWTNRQSAASAVGPTTADALIVAEALHGDAEPDIARLTIALREAVRDLWPNAVATDPSLEHRAGSGTHACLVASAQILRTSTAAVAPLRLCRSPRPWDQSPGGRTASTPPRGGDLA